MQKFKDPLDIINGPLMKGMDEVGRLFNNNELIVAEVLQSAEVMKASVAFLEPYMEKKSDDNGKGKIILATVKGDVHDIGKNLVEIILSNNGFKIVNLGIKVTSNQLIEAIAKEKPTAIGLSGLLVKSAQQMVLTAQDLRQQNVSIPILVGGAALTRKFTNTKIAAEYEGLVLYAKDAMNGLEIANRIVQPGGQQRMAEELAKEAHAREEVQQKRPQSVQVIDKPKRSDVAMDVKVYTPTDLKAHILRDYSIAHLEPYINMQMLLGRHLGLQGKVSRLLDEGNERALALKEKVDALLQRVKQKKLLKAHGMYRFFPAQGDGDDIIIYDPNNQQAVLERFSFPRQPRAPYLCLADYLRPVSSGEMDYVGFLAVTAGQGVRDLAETAKEEGDYLFSHLIQASALEIAEGFAERVHQQMRDRWGFPDSADFTMRNDLLPNTKGFAYHLAIRPVRISKIRKSSFAYYSLRKSESS